MNSLALKKFNLSVSDMRPIEGIGKPRPPHSLARKN